MAETTIGGGVFNVEPEGDPTKPALLLSNALGTNLAMWEPRLSALVRHCRVIRYDSRGDGKSTELGAPYSLRRLGRDVLAILDSLEIERAEPVTVKPAISRMEKATIRPSTSSASARNGQPASLYLVASKKKTTSATATGDAPAKRAVVKLSTSRRLAPTRSGRPTGCGKW